MHRAEPSTPKRMREVQTDTVHTKNEMLHSREVAEAAREAEWQGAGFLRDLFLGKFDIRLIHPYPLGQSERPEFRHFYDKLKQFLRESVNADEIDRLGEYPPA